MHRSNTHTILSCHLRLIIILDTPFDVLSRPACCSPHFASTHNLISPRIAFNSYSQRPYRSLSTKPWLSDTSRGTRCHGSRASLRGSQERHADVHISISTLIRLIPTTTKTVMHAAVNIRVEGLTIITTIITKQARTCARTLMLTTATKDGKVRVTRLPRPLEHS